MLANAVLKSLLHAIDHSSTSLYRKPKPFHTTPILVHHALTILLRIIAIGEQHTFVAGGFLILADTAGLHVFANASAFAVSQDVSMSVCWEAVRGKGASGADRVGWK